MAKSVQVEALTLVDLLRCRAEQQPEQLAYVMLRAGKPAGEMTYGALDQRARTIAAGLEAELEIGDRAVLVYPYSAGIEFMAAFLGCLYAGIVAVPSHAPRNRYGLDDLLARLSSAGARALLTPASLQAKLKRQFAASAFEESETIRWIVPEQIPDSAATAWTPPLLTPETLAFLQYTSGSSGQPKGVKVTHGGLLHNQRALQQAFGHSAQTIGAGWLPLFHDMGLIGNALQVLYLGTFCVLMSPIDFMQQPVLWLQAISRYRATTSGGPNFAYDMLCRQVPENQLASLDLSSWEVAFSGAEPVRPETMAQFSAKFAPCGFRREAFYPCYGMAEAVLFITGGQKSQNPKIITVDPAALSQNRVEPSDSDQGRTLVSCGQTWLDGEIAIADPTTHHPLTPNHIGEIWYSSSGLGQGYWQQPELTEQTFHALLKRDSEKAGPFLRTGDLGFLHQEELFITGRLHDVMVFWGINHYPHHIEQTVQTCHPAFRQNGTAAFAAPLHGQERLIIVQEIERRDRNQLQAKGVIETVRRKVFQEHFVDVAALLLLKPGRLPRTPSGKIQRRTCQTHFAAGTLDPLDAWQAPPTQPSDPATLVRRYLNPLTYLKGYTATARHHLRHWLS